MLPRGQSDIDHDDLIRDHSLLIEPTDELCPPLPIKTPEVMSKAGDGSIPI